MAEVGRIEFDDPTFRAAPRRVVFVPNPTHAVNCQCNGCRPGWLAVVEAAVAAEREANCRAVCEGCEAGWPREPDDEDLHRLPEVGETGQTHHRCDAAAIRARGAA